MYKLGSMSDKNEMYSLTEENSFSMLQMGEYEVLKRWLFINGRGPQL